MPEQLPEKLSIVRNEVSVDFVPTAYKRGKKAEAGEMYLTVPQNITFDELVKYVGQDDARGILLARVNLLAQGWYESATTRMEGENEVSKPFDTAEFTKYATEFSARGLSKDEILEAIKSGTDELLALLINTSLSAEDKQVKATALTKRIQGLNSDLASRKKEKKTEEAAS